ncbi:MAG: TolC family protein [Gemmatimonadota bacterium]
MLTTLWTAAAFLGQTPTAAPIRSDTLTLVRAIELGRARGIGATLARIGERIAGNRVGQRRSELLPNVSGGASYTRQTLNLDEFGIPIATGVTDPFSVFHLTLRASQTIFDPAAFRRVSAARDSVIAAGLDASTAGVLAGVAAGLAYLRAQSAWETVRAREADSVVAVRLLEQARQLKEAGVSTGIDLTRSEVNTAVVRSQLALARNDRDRTRLDLNRALDFPGDTTLILATTIDGTVAAIPTDPAEAVKFALDHRTEVRAERQRLAVAEKTRAAIRAENLPSVAASGAYTQGGRETGNLKGTYVAQIGVAIPIFDGRRRHLRADEEGLRIEGQEARLHDLEGQVDVEARRALLDFASATEQVALAQERERLALLELAQAEERFRAGVAGTIETTNAQTGLIAARDAVIQALVSRGVARVSVYKALGILEQM